jgi:hypothetical protein
MASGDVLEAQQRAAWRGLSQQPRRYRWRQPPVDRGLMPVHHAASSRSVGDALADHQTAVAQLQRGGAVGVAAGASPGTRDLGGGREPSPTAH